MNWRKGRQADSWRQLMDDFPYGTAIDHEEELDASMAQAEAALGRPLREDEAEIFWEYIDDKYSDEPRPETKATTVDQLIAWLVAGASSREIMKRIGNDLDWLYDDEEE